MDVKDEFFSPNDEQTGQIKKELSASKKVTRYPVPPPTQISTNSEQQNPCMSNAENSTPHNQVSGKDIFKNCLSMIRRLRFNLFE